MNRHYLQALIPIACMLLLSGCNTTAPLIIGAIEEPNPKDEQSASFSADTLVMMEDGSSRKIIDIAIGDKVKSFNIQTGTVVNTEVIKTKSGFSGYYYLIDGGLKVTPPHPFCTPDDKWVKIKDLSAGQTVRISNSIRKISSIEQKMETQRIYNIFVKDNHNFFVSGDGKDFFLVKQWR